MGDKLIKIDKNGTKYYADCRCQRCGGAGGLDQWAYTGWTCYDCGGTGIAPKPQIWKEYTPEYKAKLDERRKKREQKKSEERKANADTINAQFYENYGFDENGIVYVALGDTYKIKDRLKELGYRYDGVLGWHGSVNTDICPTLALKCVEIYKKREDNTFCSFYVDDKAFEQKIKDANLNLETKDGESDFVGEVGKRLELTLTINREFTFESHFGYRTQENSIYLMSDTDGNVFTWKTAGGIACLNEKGRWEWANVGDKVVLKGTVKEHEVYKGVKQTVLTRCKVERIEKAD